MDSQQIIDQVLDVAEQMLAGQREFAKSFAANAFQQPKQYVSNLNPLSGQLESRPPRRPRE